MDQSKVTRWIETSFERDLVHSDTDEVLPLHSQHRRKVTFSVRVSVHHANLDIEFLTLRKFCRDLWAGDTHHVGNTSLEQIGENLLQVLTKEYPRRTWEIRILEDAENGAVIQYADAA